MTNTSHGALRNTDQELKFQIRLQLSEGFAKAVRASESKAELQSLYAALTSNSAELVCQYDAFAGYCSQVEQSGELDNTLYRWTKATLEDPAKVSKYLTIFTIYVNDAEVYDQPIADRLEQELQGLVDGSVIVKMNRYDTNPTNNPQAPEKYRS